MGLEEYRTYASEPDLVGAVINLTGAGAANPTKNYGKGVAVTRTGVGVFLATFTDPPGNLVGYNGELSGTVPSSLAGFSTVLGAPTLASGATKFSVSISIFNQAFAAVDLTAAQLLNWILWFKRAGQTV